MKRVSIIQSSYIPWKGYFDIIAASDEFIVLESVQYTKHDWRNRNLIKTPTGAQWLTVPVITSNRFGQTISETHTAHFGWAKKHWKSIAYNYAKSSHFDEFSSHLEMLFQNAASFDKLSEINYYFLSNICHLLGVNTPITFDLEYDISCNDPEDRIIQLCKSAGATHYLSGPSAGSYITPGRFAAEGLTLEYADYSQYPMYDQPHPPFQHGVSVLDLLLCKGSEAPTYMYFGSEKKLGIVHETPADTGLNL